MDKQGKQNSGAIIIVIAVIIAIAYFYAKSKTCSFIPSALQTSCWKLLMGV